MSRVIVLRATSREKCRLTLSRPPAASFSQSAWSRIRADHRVGRGIVADQYVASRRQMHALDRRRRGDDRQTEAHRLIDLALDAGAIA